MHVAASPTHVPGRALPNRRPGASLSQSQLVNALNVFWDENDFLRRERNRAEETLLHTETQLRATQEAVKKQNDLLRRQRSAVVETLRHAETQLQAKQGEVEKLREQSAVLRDIVLGQAGTQKISDDEVVQGFLKLRQTVQRLVHSLTDLLEEVPKLHVRHRERVEVVQFYYGRWGSWLPKDRALQMRARVFQILHNNILKRDCFGLDGFEKDKVDGPLALGKKGQRDPLGTIEPGLRRFESLLREKGKCRSG